MSKNWQLDEGHIVEPVFISRGKQFYRLNDTLNTFCSRALDALSVYEEWQMRCRKDDLIAFTTAIDNILSDPKKIRIGELYQINDALKKRAEWVIPSSEIVWRFAAIAFFDENESPYKYDDKYGREKIAKWKESDDIPDFFFAKITEHIIPSPNLSDIDLTNYFKVVDLMEKKDLERILPLLSLQDRQKDFYKKLISRNIITQTSPV